MGIAEQKLINFACGLALEKNSFLLYDFKFSCMRCFEQIRTNIAIMSEYYDLNINLIGVGAGLSYDISGPLSWNWDINIMHSFQTWVITPSDALFCENS